MGIQVKRDERNNSNKIGSVLENYHFMLKEYYEIVGESHPLSVFFPTHADC